MSPGLIWLIQPWIKWLKQLYSFLTQPNMYARGILFGKMKYELGDHSFVRCPENHLSADIDFKTKGYFGGTYNAIGGTIKNEQSGEILYEISGMWSGEMSLRDVLVEPILVSLNGCPTDTNVDRPQRSSIWCDQCQTLSAYCPAIGRARRAWISEVVV